VFFALLISEDGYLCLEEFNAFLSDSRRKEGDLAFESLLISLFLAIIESDCTLEVALASDDS
jgi:hypothetical protein